jgi:hypothetical protein
MARTRHYRGSISVDVDISDVFDEIPDDDLLAEVEDRGLIASNGLDRDYAERALHALAARRYAEAEALLDRALLPQPVNSKEAAKTMQSLFAQPKRIDDRTNASTGSPVA